MNKQLSNLWTKLSVVLDIFERIQNRLDPAFIDQYQKQLQSPTQDLKIAVKKTPQQTVPEEQQNLLKAAQQVLKGLSRFQSASPGPQGIMSVFQSLRSIVRAQEYLYALVYLEKINIHFLEKFQHNNESMLEKISTASKKRKNSNSNSDQYGLINISNKREQRGGFSLYVPEYYTSNKSWPLVLALHGGSGHGADFLWSWVREARSLGFIVAAPTSQGNTWSMRQPAIDAGTINRMLDYISEHWRIDTKYILISGISDGATFSLLLMSVKQAPFTHYAPIASAAHVLVNRAGVVALPVKGIPIYHVHGVRDWMFPVANARMAKDALIKAGANLVYREIEDLSHNYPRDENINILKWFYPSFQKLF